MQYILWVYISYYLPILLLCFQLIYVLIFLAVLCVVLFFGMLGAFFLWHDARHGTKLKKYKEDREEENKYSETIDY